MVEVEVEAITKEFEQCRLDSIGVVKRQCPLLAVFAAVSLLFKLHSFDLLRTTCCRTDGVGALYIAQSVMVACVCRRSSAPTGRGNTGRAGMVSRPARDDADSPVCRRHGRHQGKITKHQTQPCIAVACVPRGNHSSRLFM